MHAVGTILKKVTNGKNIFSNGLTNPLTQPKITPKIKEITMPKRAIPKLVKIEK